MAITLCCCSIVTGVVIWKGHIFSNNSRNIDVCFSVLQLLWCSRYLHFTVCSWLPFNVDLRKEPLWRTYRGVIVNPSVTTTSVLRSLVSGNITSVQPGTLLSVHCDYRLDNGVVFNLMECSPVSLLR